VGETKSEVKPVSQLSSRVLASLLPHWLRRRLARWYRGLVFHIAMRRLLADPSGALARDHALLGSLLHGWANESWSASEEYLLACVREAQNSDGPVLACGSGLSTVVLAVILRQSGRALWSLEHHKGWGERVRATLALYGLRNAHVCEAPIVDYGEFEWYRAPLEEMPRDFGLIICDGPPATTRGGRYGLVPLVADRFGVRWTLLLDDAIREPEQEIASRWAKQLDASIETLGMPTPFFRITPTAKRVTI
jgi:hypothetical protein